MGRTGQTGISAGAITLSMVGAAAWLGYGIAEDLAPVIIATNLVVLPMAASASWSAWRSHHEVAEPQPG